MSYEIYEKAKKLGDKAFKAAIAKGQHPYLPVLENIIGREELRGEVSLGLIDVPLDRVVGTATEARTQSFASNFMPIMGEKTEFGIKWSNLCDAHLSEGIHDPIKVYEYLNYYYVIEGNKRVSVLKYFGADSVPAFVTRKIPKLTDDPEVRLYYEFMDFNRKSRVNFIWFSREGSFHKMLEEVGFNPEKEGTTETLVSTIADSASGGGSAIRETEERVWDDDTYLEFKAAYFRFAKIFRNLGGQKLENITTGDAFLRLVELETFRKTAALSDTEMTDAVKAMWQEFLVLNDKQAVEVSLDPPDDRKSLLQHILPAQHTESSPLKVAFLYDREPQLSDWLYQHELGRNHIKEVFGKQVQTFRVTTAGTEADAIASMENLITKQGVEVIFTTTSRLVSASLKCAIRYPNVRILNCSLNTSHRYIRTYYTRLYEAKFLSGMVAGALTETNRIGYLADYPIFGMPANINAFAIGARMVNPRARVSLKWTTTKEGGSRDDIYRSFYDEGIDYLSDQDMITPTKASRRFGMYRLTKSDPVNMTMSVSNWGVFYEKLLRIILNGAWNSTDAEDETRAVNYWWGFSAGVLDFIMSDKVPRETQRLVTTVKDAMCYDRIRPFEGEIRSQDFMVQNQEGQRMGTEQIIKMNWLADNVIGTIPKAGDMKEHAKEIVELKGVRKDEKEEQNEDSDHR